MDSAFLNVLEHSEYPEILQLCKTNSFLRNYCIIYPNNILNLIFKKAGFKTLSGHDLKKIFRFLYTKNKHLESFLKLKYKDLNHYPLTIQKFLFENCINFDCSNQHLLTLPSNLFINLQTLDCSLNKITKLDNLPGTLEILNCSDNKIKKLDNLPKNLQDLNCWHNKITQLNNLPSTLIKLNCGFNRITQLNNLPSPNFRIK